MNLKETCQMTDQEWEERQKARAEEIKAVSEALAILSSDDAHDTFTRTFNFVQTKVETKDRKHRDEAAALLKEKADEIKHKDFCTEGLNTNERESELKARDIAELEAEISDLTTTIDELTKSIA